MFLSDETIDGLLFGWALESRIARNPQAQARRKAYDDGLRADREMLTALSHDVIARAIMQMGLWTLPGAVERRSTAEMVDAVSRCMRGRDRARWMAALGLPADTQ